MSNETKKTSFRDGMISPTVILLIICLVISGALAVTYQVTAPQIEKINKETADAARMEVLPGAGSFTAADGDLPEGVTEYYTEDSGLGVVVTAQNKSFGGTIHCHGGYRCERRHHRRKGDGPCRYAGSGHKSHGQRLSGTVSDADTVR